MDDQQNFACLVGITKLCDTGNIIDHNILPLIKQRSDAWFTVRSFACVTGSTFNKAIGLEGLKKQQAHFEVVYDSKQQAEYDPDTLKRMKHGVINEINAVATLVSKVIPVFFPDLIFCEEGCYALEFESGGRLIVSPDGSLRRSSAESCSMGIEIKCPYPGKIFTTPVHYSLPLYYVPQVLSEMCVQKVETLLFISYSEQSTSVLKVEYDAELMTKLLETASDLYPKTKPVYPKRLHPNVKHLKKAIALFVKNNVHKLCEVKSVKAVTCHHEDTEEETPAYFQHNKHVANTASNVSLSDLECIALKNSACIKDAHDLSRVKATEVLVFLISDLDRIHNPEIPHAIPIAYAFKGYSMKTDIMRLLLNQVLHECYKQGIYVPVISFDGQWYNIAIRDRHGEPLTLLQLQKDVYNESKQISKADMLKRISAANTVQTCDVQTLQTVVDLKYVVDCNGKISCSIIVGKIRIGERFSLSRSVHDLIVNEKTSTNIVQEELDVETREVETSSNDYILNALPEDVVSSLDDKLLSDIRQIEHSIKQNVKANRSIGQDMFEGVADLFETPEILDSDTNTLSSNELDTRDTVTCKPVSVENNDITCLTEAEYIDMLKSLQDSRDGSCWELVDLQQFLVKLSSVESMQKSFRKREIQMCIRSVAAKLRERKIHFALSWPKYKLVELLHNLQSKPAIDNQFTGFRKRTSSPKCLKTLCRKVVSSLSKNVLNALFAEHIFPDRLKAWRQKNPFADGSSVSCLDDTINWYSRPENYPERYQYTFSLLDPHHLFTNARTKCCKTGIPIRNIKRDAWLKVATDGKTSLNIALVEDLIDRQSDQFARMTFSKEVENEMQLNGDKSEAEFCSLIRNWYEAEDQPGISAKERCAARLDLRRWLLKKVKFNSFPPPGSHIQGIPLVMFEGLMTNIDRRLQLFSFVKKGTYNVRSLGSLEAENLFGEFQDLDPKGNGVIRPDDIPCALSTACEILSHRMDEKRNFYMSTSKAKCYPVHQLLLSQEKKDSVVFVNPSSVRRIETKDHIFDTSSRSTGSTNKHKVTISSYNAPSRGAKPVRQHHRCNEEKIMPHKRQGIQID